MRKRSSIFWGILLIILASLLLLQQFNILPGNLWDFFWPAVLILVGVWMVIGYFQRGRKLATDQVSLDLGTARSVSIKMEHGAGNLVLHSGAPTGMALTGSCRGGLHINSDTSGDGLEVKLNTPSQFWDWAPGNGLDWDLALTGEVPLKLNIHNGASSADFDLTNLVVTDLKVETGASTTTIKMPAHAGSTIADIDAGVSSLKITIPEGVAGRLRIKGGLNTLQMNQERFPRTDGELYQSPDYATANNRIDLTIDSGVGTVEIH